MSDIWIKTSNTSTTKWRKALAISIKRGTSTWSSAKNIWIKTGVSSWLKVWPLSGVYATTDPYITTTASGSTPLYGVDGPIRIGTTYYGRNGTWDANGWTISSYSYSWPYYTSGVTGEIDQIGTLSTGTYATPSNALTISSTADATATDGKYISFRITANASSSAYNGIADSESTYGRLQVIRRTPQNISASLTGTASVGQILTYASSWNTTEAYKINVSRSTIKWYKSTSNTDIYEGGSRVEITRASGSYTITLSSGDNLDGYYIIAEESVYNTGSDYAIGQDLTTKDLNRITKVTTSAVSVPYTFTFGSSLYVSTNGYVSLDNGNASDSISGTSTTTGRVIGILPGDLKQSTTTSLWYWSNTTQFIIRWEGYLYSDVNNLRQYEIVFDTAQNYVTVYPILVTSGSGGTQAFVKDGVVKTSYSAGLGTGNWRRVYLDGVTAPTTQSGPYVVKDKSVMVQSLGLTYGTTDIGYTTLATSINQSVTPPTPGAFTTISFTKAKASASLRSLSLSWNASANGPNYEVQYEGSSNGSTWIILQTFDASTYKTATSDTYSATEYKYYRASVRARNSNKDLATAAYSDGGTSSSYVYISATGTSPGQPTIGTITVTQTTASAAFTHPADTGSSTIDWIQFSLDASTWYNDYSSPFDVNPPMGGLTAGTSYTLYARSLNYDGLYSTSTYKYFTTNAAPAVSVNSYPTISGTGAANTNLTFASGSYNNASTITKTLYASTSTSFSTGSTNKGSSSPYGVTSSDAAAPAYYFAVLDTVLGTNGITYYFWSGGYTGSSATIPNGSGSILSYVPLVIPTISMLSNTGVSTSGATINWSSSNQSYATVDGVNVGSATSYAFTGKSASTTYSGTVIVYSSSGNSASASYSFTTSTAFTAPSAGAPALQFLRTSGSSRLDWYCDYPGISGNGTITGMDWEIRTTAGGGTLLNSGTRAYPGAGTYPYSAAGTVWAFRMGTANGDISYSASARYGRARVNMLGSNGTTYYGTWSGWI